MRLRPSHYLFCGSLLVTLFISFFSFAVSAQYSPQYPLNVSDPFRQIALTVPLDNWEIRVEDLMGTTLTNNSQNTTATVHLVHSLVNAKTPLEQVWQDKLTQLKKNKSKYVFIKEHDTLTIDQQPAIGITYKELSKGNIVRLIIFVAHNQYCELTFDISSESVFKQIKPQLSFILDHIKIPSVPVTGLNITDPVLGVSLSVPANKEWGFETEDVYKQFYYIPTGQYARQGLITLFNSVYSRDSTKSANADLMQKFRQQFPTGDVLIQDQIFTHSGTEICSSTFKNPDDKTVVRALNFLNNGSSVMMEFIVVDSYFDRVKSDFSSIMKNLQISSSHEKN